MLVTVATLAVLPASAAPPPAFTLARAGRPAATVVLARRPTPSARFAAHELVEHVRRISGATLPIVADDRPVRGPRVLVGESRATRALGLRSEAFADQEYLVRLRPGLLVLLGRDGLPRPGTSGARREPGRAEGRFGRALALDGATTAALIPDCPFDDAQGALEAWVWLPAEPAEKDGTILRLDGANPWTYHILQVPTGTRAIEYRLYDGKTVTAVRSGDVTPGWRHVLATYSAATGRAELFVDGARTGGTTYGGSTCNRATLMIGGMDPAVSGGSAVGNPFRGRIDEVRLSNVPRAPGVPSGPLPPDRNTLVLLRCDEPEGPPADLRGHTPPVPLPGFFDGNGTLYAVYEFLERFCGVRWYQPGPHGTVVPRQRTLTVRGPDVRRKPAMAYRWITPTPLYMPTPVHRLTARETDLWRLRLRLGGMPYQASHSFEAFYERFLTTHPDWFAQGYEGRPPQLCFTNPDLVRQVVQDARDYFDGKGAPQGAQAMGDYYALVPMDNMSWCRCARCQALMNPKEANNPQFNNGKASDLVWGFVNAVAREVRKTHPDKWIAALAYSDYAYRPTREPVEPNVAVQLCLHTRNWWCPSMEANDRKVLEEWTRDRDRPVYLWLYYCFPALQAQYDHYDIFPGFFAHTAVRQMEWFRRAGIRGLFIEHSSEFGQSVLGDIPDLWVTLKLADEPEQDGNALIDEYFRRFYGAAAAPMERLYALLERTYSRPDAYPESIRTSPAHQHQTRAIAWGSLGTPERMAALRALMAEARAAARTSEERARVSLFERGVWEPMERGARAWAERSRPGQGAGAPD